MSNSLTIKPLTAWRDPNFRPNEERAYDFIHKLNNRLLEFGFTDASLPFTVDSIELMMDSVEFYLSARGTTFFGATGGNRLDEFGRMSAILNYAARMALPDNRTGMVIGQMSGNWAMNISGEAVAHCMFRCGFSEERPALPFLRVNTPQNEELTQMYLCPFGFMVRAYITRLTATESDIDLTDDDVKNIIDEWSPTIFTLFPGKNAGCPVAQDLVLYEDALSTFQLGGFIAQDNICRRLTENFWNARGNEFTKRTAYNLENIPS